MIKVVVPPRTNHQVQCLVCSAVLEYTSGDVSTDAKNEEGYIMCPVCGSRISHSRGTKLKDNWIKETRNEGT